MQAYLDQVIEVLRAGFAQIGENPKGVLIALAAVVFMRTWAQWIPAAIISVVIYIAIEHFAPVLAGQRELSLPPLMEAAFWGRTGILLAGFLIVTAVMFFIKRIIMSAAGAGGAKAKH